MLTVKKFTIGGKFKSVQDIVKYLKKVAAYYKGHMAVKGNLAEALNLTDGQTISGKYFTKLLQGKDLNGKRFAGKNRVPGYDFCITMPKSFSIELLVNKNKEMLDIHNEAVAETMKEIERYQASSRDQRGGATKVENTGKLLYLQSIHNTSRKNDPNLHTHCFILNTTQTAEGKFLTLHGKDLLQRGLMHNYGAIYRSKLAAKAIERGYPVSYLHGGEIRLDNISFEMDMKFSKRTEEIKSAMEMDKELTENQARFKTRSGKEELTQKELDKRWLQEINTCKKTSIHENQEALEQLRKEWAGEYINKDIQYSKHAKYLLEAQQEKELDRANISDIHRWQLAVKRATAGVARVDKMTVIREYIFEQQRAGIFENLSVEQYQERLNEQVQKNLLVAVDDKITSYDLQFQELFIREKIKDNIIKDIEKTKIDDIEKEYQKFKERISEQNRCPSARQEEAIKNILSSDKRMLIIQGVSGGGKTTAMRAVKNIARAQKEPLQIIGLCQQGVAARKLENESGIKSQTLASFIHSRQTTGNRIIIVDEASMVGIRDMAAVLKIAQQSNDKVVFIGDKDQILPIGAGAPFKDLVRIAEDKKELIILDENYRQQTEELREIAGLCQKGEVGAAISLADDYGYIKRTKSQDKREKQIAREYDPKTLIIAGTNESRERLNELILKREWKLGWVKKRELKTITTTIQNQDGTERAGDMRIAAGVQIIFTKNSYDKNIIDIRNGEQGKITEVNGNNIKVLIKTDDEKEKEVSFDLDKYNYIDYGYALTTYKAQGQSVDKVVINTDTNNAAVIDMNNQYVNMTRAKWELKIFTDDKNELIELSGKSKKVVSSLTGAETYADILQKAKTVRAEIQRQDQQTKDKRIIREANPSLSEKELMVLLAKEQVKQAERHYGAAAVAPVAELERPPAVEIEQETEEQRKAKEQIKEDKIWAEYEDYMETEEKLKEPIENLRKIGITSQLTKDGWVFTDEREKLFAIDQKIKEQIKEDKIWAEQEQPAVQPVETAEQLEEEQRKAKQEAERQAEIEKAKVKVGAAWQKTGADEKSFTSVSMNIDGQDFHFNMFPNASKKKAHHPDFIASAKKEDIKNLRITMPEQKEQEKEYEYSNFGIAQEKVNAKGKKRIALSFEMKGEKTYINMFPNEHKKDEKSPDFIMSMDKDMARQFNIAVTEDKNKEKVKEQSYGLER